MSRKRRVFISLSAVAGVGVALYWLVWHFRVETRPGPGGGELKVKYKWGRAHTTTLDQDRDGDIDAIYKVDAPYGRLLTHSSVTREFWEDRNGNDKFDHHVILKEGRIELVEIDLDGDGEYDESLEGDRARNYYARFSAPKSTP